MQTLLCVICVRVGLLSDTFCVTKPSLFEVTKIALEFSVLQLKEEGTHSSSMLVQEIRRLGLCSCDHADSATTGNYCKSMT